MDTSVSGEGSPVLVNVPVPPVDRMTLPLVDGSNVAVAIWDRIEDGVVVEFAEHVGLAEGSGIDVALWKIAVSMVEMTVPVVALGEMLGSVGAAPVLAD